MKVAVGIISDEEGRILITQRPLHVPHPEFWEFPGGKLEADETAESALVREIKEEVGLEVQNYELLGEIHHNYPNKTVHLFIFSVHQYSGTPSCLEGQLAMKWLEKEHLNPCDFPEGNKEIFERYL